MSVARRHLDPRLRARRRSRRSAGPLALVGVIAEPRGVDGWRLWLTFARDGAPAPAPALTLEHVQILGVLDGVASPWEAVAIEQVSGGDRPGLALTLVADRSVGDLPGSMVRVRIVGHADVASEGEPVLVDLAAAAEGPPTPLHRPPPLTLPGRDVASLRAALLDAATRAAPGWTERNPADLGVTLIDLLAHEGARLGYLQDAVATEAWPGTARLRGSVRNHLRLYDVVLDDGLSARSWLQVQVDPAAGEVIVPPGAAFCTGPDPGPTFDPRTLWTAPQVVYESSHEARVHADLHEMSVVVWGERTVLPRGTRELTLHGQHDALRRGTVLMVQGPSGAGQVVRLDRPPVLGRGPDGALVTHVTWHGEDALHEPIAVRGTRVLGNLVLAVEGGTRALPSEALDLRRDGHPGRLVLRLPGARPALVRRRLTAVSSSAQDLLAGFGPSLPDISLSETRPDGTVRRWYPRPDLLESGPCDRHFVGAVDDNGDLRLRFGDGHHGRPPPNLGALSVSVRLLAMHGHRVARGHIRYVIDAPDGILSVSNVSPSLAHRAPESVDQGRRRAPVVLRTPASCGTTAEVVDVVGAIRGVREAVAQRRWAGNLTRIVVFVLPDVSDVLPADLEAEVIGRLSVRRLLGVALDVAPPSYVPVTAQLRIGVAPGHAPGLVIDGVRQALSADPGGFFDRARWGFGQPLRGGVLIAAAGAVPGVAWVQLDTLSRRDTGVHGKDQLAIGPTEVLRLARGGLDVALGAAP